MTAIVEDNEADTLFDLIYEHANVGPPGGGMVLMASIELATPFLMPAGVPEETG